MSACTISGCERSPYARGWCRPHYMRWWRSGDPNGRPQVNDGTCSVEGCGKPAHQRGMCRAHHQRWWRSGDPHGGRRARPRPTELPEAFWDLVERTERCWLWRGVVDAAGYPQWHGWSAALLVYEALVGPVPPGHVVGLACPDGERRCVRPEHRRPVPRGGRYDPVHGIVTFGTAIEQCRNGHTRTPENTRTTRGYRECLVCRSEAQRQRNRRRRATQP